MNIGYVFLLVSVTIAAISQLLLKAGANKKYSTFIRQYLNVYVITGYGLTFLSMLLTMLAYRNIDYKYGPVIESLGFIIILVLSRLIFKEMLTFKKIAGACIILVGIFIYYL